MTERDEQNVINLELVAATAKMLAHGIRNGRLWEGDLEKHLGTIQEALRYVRR